MPLAVVALAMACEGNPPVHTGDGLLEFGTTVVGVRGQVTRTTRLSLYAAAPFDHWGYHATALVGETDSTGVPGSFDLTAFPLHPANDGTSEPFMRYTSTAPFWRHGVPHVQLRRVTLLPVDLHDQHEVLLFPRDPAEQAATVRAIPKKVSCVGGVCGATNIGCSSDNDCGDVEVVSASWLSDWEHEWAFGRSPLVPRMMYPPQQNLTTLVNGQTSNPPDLVAGVVTSDFWPSTPVGPGAAPDGSGSIKAVKIVNHGVCGAFQPYVTADPSHPGLLQQVAQGLPKALLESVADADNRTCDTIEEKYLVSASYLDFTTDQEDAQHGGFVIGMHIQSHVPALYNGGPNFTVYFKQAWRLFDGRLTTEGEILGFSGQGPLIDSVHEGFDTSFTREMDAPVPIGQSGRDLAQSIWSDSYFAQRFLGIPNLQPTFTNCAPRPDGRVVKASGDMSSPCEFWRNTIENQLNTAVTGVGASVLGLNSNEQMEIVNDDFDATEVVGNDTVWKNIRCADVGDTFPPNDPRAPGRVGPVCYYELPAKRLNVYPDGVEVVFLDQLKELDNPVYPIWLMLLEAEGEGQVTTLSPLCDDPIPESTGSIAQTRAFSTWTERFDVTYECQALDAALCNGHGLQGCCCDVIGPAP